MNNKINVYFFIRVLYCLLLLSSLIPDLCIFGIKVWYLSILLSFLFFIFHNKILIPKCPIYSLLLWGIFVSFTIGYYLFGIQRQVANYLLAFVTMCFTYSFTKVLGVKKSEQTLQIVTVLFGLAVLLNTVVNIKTVIRYIFYASYLNHPEFNGITNGGLNIDASWLAILAVSFYSSSKRYYILFYSFFISLLFNSRAGLILNCCLLIIFFKNDRKSIMHLVCASAIALPVIVYSSIQTGLMSRSLNRLVSIGDYSEPGTIGRLNMWREIPNIVKEYPFGVGLGNSMNAINAVTFQNFTDGNFHNLILEHLVTQNIFGMLIYLFLSFSLCKYLLKRKNRKNIFAYAILLYLFAGMVEFSGCESFIFLLIGSFWGVLCTTKKRELKMLH